MNRRTIARPVSLEGIGLHLGAACQLTFRPGASGAGISSAELISPARRRFQRSPSARVLTERHTQLGEDPVCGAHGGARARRGRGVRHR